jgi:hypothetical protein
MPGAAVSLVLVADEPASRRVAEALFPTLEYCFLTRSQLRPPAPFAGPLFATLGAQPAGACVALVVPVVLLDGVAPGAPDASALLAVADHVNVALRGPLSGPWPAAVPRTFPPLAGIYQPAVVRAAGGARVYSSGVVVAGVADAGRLTSFESGVVRAEGICAVSDTLVPAAIVAAYHALTLAACAVPQAPERE